MCCFNSDLSRSCYPYSSNLPKQLDYSDDNIPNVWGFKNCINDLTFREEIVEEFTKYENDGIGMCEKEKTRHIYTWPSENRKNLVKTLTVFHRVMDICGYIPGVSIISGLIRLIAAAVFSSAIEKGIKNDVIKGIYCDEARWTVKGHVIRGCLEAFLPVIGQIINLKFDYDYFHFRNKLDASEKRYFDELPTRMQYVS